MIPKKLLTSIPLSIRTMRRLTAECLDGSITIQQFRVLKLVEEGMGQTEMADTLQVSMAAISKMINGLVEKKLVDRRPGKDRRCQMLKLTSQGNKILKVVTDHVAKRFEIGLKQLSLKEKTELQRGLEILEIYMQFMKEV